MTDAIVQMMQWLLIALNVGVGVVLMSIAEATDTPAPICSCGATERHATAEDRCARGHVLTGNATARKSGQYAFEARGPASLPDPLRASIDDFRQQVLTDRGGVENLTAIEVGYVRRLSELETVARLLASDLAARGLFTPRGRVRSTHARWLETLDRWSKFADRVGVQRVAKPAMTLESYLRAREAPQDEHGPDATDGEP